MPFEACEESSGNNEQEQEQEKELRFGGGCAVWVCRVGVPRNLKRGNIIYFLSLNTPLSEILNK